jgi:SET domain-containing protein
MTDKSKYAVKKSSAGLGLFATADFKKGDFIIEYTGEKITEAEANRRGGKYLFELNDDWTIDGKSRENTARYLNHACKPNCEPELDENEEHIYIYAKRNIKAGEELTYNYGKMYFNDYIGKDNCRCASCVAARTT